MLIPKGTVLYSHFTARLYITTQSKQTHTFLISNFLTIINYKQNLPSHPHSYTWSFSKGQRSRSVPVSQDPLWPCWIPSVLTAHSCSVWNLSVLHVPPGFQLVPLKYGSFSSKISSLNNWYTYFGAKKKKRESTKILIQ